MGMQTETLYIGNATKQNIDFQYRVAQAAPVRAQPIPAGTQIKIAGELTPAEVDYIVLKHAKYGVVAADSIDQSKGFHGTCYSIGKPITSVRLHYLMQQNHAALIVQGREIREQTAVAQSNMLETTLIEQGRPERLTEMDLTIQQENHTAGDEVPQLSEGFKIIRGGMADTPAPRGRGKRRAA